MKCVIPLIDGSSSLEPTSTHTPTDADRTWEIFSVTTRNPFGNSVFLYTEGTAVWLGDDRLVRRDVVFTEGDTKSFKSLIFMTIQDTCFSMESQENSGFTAAPALPAMT
jgi:hypothetical protein